MPTAPPPPDLPGAATTAKTGEGLLLVRGSSSTTPVPQHHTSLPEFARGAVAAFVNITVTFPANKLMFRQQAYGLRAAEAFASMKAEGVAHLYRGILPPLVQKSVSMSLMFGLYDLYRHRLRASGLSDANAGHIAAIMAGSTEALLTPFERIQTLLQLPKYNAVYHGMFHAGKELRRFGPAEYYRGFIPIMTRNSISNAIYFAARVPLMNKLPAPESCKMCLHLRNFVTGAVLGATISTLFFPINVAKSVIQTRLGGPHQNMFAVLVEVYHERGLLGIYRGSQINFTRALVSWGVINLTYELLQPST